MLLIIKFLGAPLLIGLASLAGRRFGANIAGLLSGLPVIAGPIVLVVWLEHGADYAAHVAWTLPIGQVALAAYIWTFARMAPRYHWSLCLGCGWCIFGLVAWLCAQATIPYSIMATVGLGILLTVGLTLPTPAPTALSAMPKMELVARMLAALLLVASVTTLSTRLGAMWTGMLAAFPVAGSVLPAFTLARNGPNATLLLLRGMICGLLGLAACFLCIAYLLPLWGGGAFLAGLVVACGIAGLLSQWLPRWSLRR